MTTEQELNKKLAEWVGFKFSHRNRIKNFFTGELGRYVEFWVYPDKDILDLPNLTQSLDACFKWLVPKVDGWRVVIYCNGAGGFTSYIDSNGKCCMWEETLSSAETPALALCRATEKLIGASNDK